MPKVYRYVGPKQIAERASTSPPGFAVGTASDIRRWIERTQPRPNHSGSLTATFVVDPSGKLLLADRHSEHVACAGGGPVLAAGEMTLSIQGGSVNVEQVSNQSTGYCPEPESWSALAAALELIGVSAPEGYTTELLFRRCPRCSQINVVKDSIFECAVCASTLPESWNLDSEANG